jgi:phosphatidylglycerophosphatase A
MDSLKLYIAQGFGVGRIPFAPGTWGSVVGVLWTMVLCSTSNLWLYLAGTVLGLAASVWFCGEGERILREKDPGSVVLDEIAALPICFLPLAAQTPGSSPWRCSRSFVCSTSPSPGR